MTASPDDLRTLHRIHQQLAELRARLERGPKQIRAKQQGLERSEQHLADSKDAWKKTRMESDGQQVQLEERETKIEELQRQLNECRKNDAFQNLKDRIAAERKASSVLQDEILDKLDRVDQLQVQVHEAESNLEKARQELDVTQKRVGEQQTSLENDLARATDQLKQAEAGLPADFKAEYQRLTRAHGDQALAPAEGETCGNCFTVLSPQTMNELYMSKMVFCKSCGCMLYLPEDRSVGHVEERN